MDFIATTATDDDVQNVQNAFFKRTIFVIIRINLFYYQNNLV